MAAKNHRFRLVFRRLLAGAVGACALLILACFAYSPARCRAQSQPAQQPSPPPAQPATKDPSSAPSQPANQSANQPGSQPDAANTQRKADSDDDWPAPEWEVEEKPAAQPNPATQAPTTPGASQPATSSHAVSGQAGPGAQAAAAQTDSTAAQPAVAATPRPRPDYKGMTPDDRRKAEVADECAYLLKLATDLKAQVDKASKDELSVSVVRKAAELEQVAHKVRNGTALSAGNEPGPEPKQENAQ